MTDYKQIHPLLQHATTSDSVTDDAESIGLTAKGQEEDMVEDTDDLDLQPLLRQLKNHLASMMSNQAQVAGVEEAMSRAETALARVL